MTLSTDQISLLKQLMINSSQKGNLPNAGLVIENGKTLVSAESWVVTNHDATAHSERMLVETVCKLKNNNYTPGLIMVTVCEPCLMCLSACAQAGYKSIAYVLSATKYVAKMPWIIDTLAVDKQQISKTFFSPLELIHLSEYEKEFSEIFEKLSKKHLK